MNESENFTMIVYNIVSQIPIGKVMTYGQVAWLTGLPNRCRMFGWVLRKVPDSMGLPCHRVVNSQWKLAHSFPEQRERLIMEGVVFKKNGDIDLKISQWHY